jgi:hypothetical protein
MSCAERPAGVGRSEKGSGEKGFSMRDDSVSCLGCFVPFRIQAANDSEAGTQKAWDMVDTAAASRKTDERADGMRALGLLRNDVHARNLARQALEDPKPEVRVAAATSPFRGSGNSFPIRSFRW